jgi:folylpolyglutamate synthase/dihydropteroate synthase
VRELAAAEASPIRILICGSLYLAGQVLAEQQGAQAQAN